MTYFEGVILSQIEAIFWLLLIFAIFGEKIRYHRRALLACMPIIFLISMSSLVLPIYAASILLHIGLAAFILIVFRKDLLISVATAAYSSFLVFAAQGIVTGFLSLFVELEYTFVNGLMIMSMLLVAGIYVYSHVSLYFVTEGLEKNRVLLIVVTVISLSFLHFMLFLETSATIMEHMRNLGLFLLVLSVGTASILGIKAIYQAARKKDAQAHYEETEEMLSKLGRQQSSIEKNIQLVYYLAVMNDFDKNEYHIRKHLYSFENDSDLLRLRNKPLAMYLYVKMNQLKDDGIICHLTIDNYFIGHNINPHTLLQAVDIIVTNAVEALKDGDNEIFINLTYEENGYTLHPIIEVLNKHEEIWGQEQQQLYEKGFTTKDKQKGVGLYNLSMLSKKNNFEVSFTNREVEGENYVCFGIEFIN